MIHRLSTYDPRKHHRTSLRLQGYDYSNPGLYFITVCVYGRECLFGKIIEENMRLSELGEVAKQCWDEIPRHFHNIGLDEYQIMPNHLHGILSINVGTQHVGDVNRRDVQLNVPTRISPKRGTLSVIVRTYKAAVTKLCLEKGFYHFQWQNRFYDHIIRNEEDLNRIREYIKNNPLNWNEDQENPTHRKQL